MSLKIVSLSERVIYVITVEGPDGTRRDINVDRETYATLRAITSGWGKEERRAQPDPRGGSLMEQLRAQAEKEMPEVVAKMQHVGAETEPDPGELFYDPGDESNEAPSL